MWAEELELDEEELEQLLRTFQEAQGESTEREEEPVERGSALLGWAGILLLAASSFLQPPFSWAEAPPSWQVGDVFVAVGDGTYRIFDRQGRLKHTLAGELGGYTADCGFNPGMDRLYTANFTHTQVVVYEDGAGHGVVQHIDAGVVSPQGRSSGLVFDKEGRFFVGHAGGNRLIHQYDARGRLLATYPVAGERRGVRGLDLASDQRTLFYTAGGRWIHRLDTATGEELWPFAGLEGEGHAFGLRLLPPGDGTGGLLVADGGEIKQLDGTGQVARVYDAQGQDAWFALNLDPDGRSFWAADSESDRLYRFDLLGGQVLQQLQAGPGNTLFGVCVKGELKAGVGAEAVRPLGFALGQNAPNPFNPSTQISYSLPAAGPVSLAIYNLLGQQVRTLAEGEQQAGIYRVHWDGTDDQGWPVSSGVYLYRFESRGRVESRRMVLVK
jgi:outer membrane protein assembly factor BamB